MTLEALSSRQMEPPTMFPKHKLIMFTYVVLDITISGVGCWVTW
jgi:hypothetical protein